MSQPLEIKIKKPRADAPPAPRFYANNAFVTASPWDISIAFGEVIQKVEGGDDLTGEISAELEPRTVIVMSHQHAAAFLEVFQKTLKQVADANMAEVSAARKQ